MYYKNRSSVGLDTATPPDTHCTSW